MAIKHITYNIAIHTPQSENIIQAIYIYIHMYTHHNLTFEPIVAAYSMRQKDYHSCIYRIIGYPNQYPLAGVLQQRRQGCPIAGVLQQRRQGRPIGKNLPYSRSKFPI